MSANIHKRILGEKVLVRVYINFPHSVELMRLSNEKSVFLECGLRRVDGVGNVDVLSASPSAPILKPKNTLNFFFFYPIVEHRSGYMPLILYLNENYS